MRMADAAYDDLLWSPPADSQPQCTLFRHHISSKHSLRLDTYEDLWRWSIDNRGDFWSEVWDWHEVIGAKGEAPYVDESQPPSANPKWFEGASLNWAENQLRHASQHPDDIAVIQISEPCAGWNPPTVEVTQKELLRLVGRLQRSLRNAGVGKGDRVGWWGANCLEAIVVLLATTSLGAIFSSAAADFGVDGVAERLQLIRPKVLFVANGVVYAGTPRPLTPLLQPLLNRLEHPPEEVVIVSHLPDSLIPKVDVGSTHRWEDFLDQNEGEVFFDRVGFNDPIWILFSSGTTGKPKAIVHRHGGMLLGSLREHRLVGDVGRGDVYFFYTTPGWMMFQYLVSALATGATIVAYEGSPLKRLASMWDIIDDLGVTLFGTSAKYIEQISKNYPDVKSHHSLRSLKQILSTGSPLAPALFDFVYTNIKKDVLLGSVTGGTDLCSVFAGRNTCLPVFRGEIQARMPGFALDTTSTDADEPGELIVRKAFPLEPVGFWPLEGFGFPAAEVEDAKARFQDSYFRGSEGYWYHGDYIRITPSRFGNGGGVIALGRSDGVLNPGGIRFGPMDIYSVLDTDEFHKLGVDETLVVGLLVEDGTDERVILFVKLHDGVELDTSLEKKIKTAIRLARSARHVPANIIKASDIPMTLTGKKVEVPIRKLINGASIDSINPATLRNPKCLAEYMEIGMALRRERDVQEGKA